MFNLTVDEYYQAIKDYSNIMIFGANWNGYMNQSICESLKKEISCYLVSSRAKAKAGSVIRGVPVKQIDDISPSEKQEGLVIVGRSYENHIETVQLLQKHGFCHIIPGLNQRIQVIFNMTVDDEYYQAIKDYSTIMIFGTSGNEFIDQHKCESLKKEISCYLVSSNAKVGSAFCGIPVKRIDDISPSEKQEGLVIVGMPHENHAETVRLLQKHGFCHIILGLNQRSHEVSEKQAALLKALFGSDLLCHIPSVEGEEGRECSLKIYAVTSVTNFHKAKQKWDSKYIEYIQAGAALSKERICAITDDTGKNISQYNRYLNETTAGYWIAKNDNQHEYVGLFHYSRGFHIGERQLEWIVEHNIDVVLCSPLTSTYNSTWHGRYSLMYEACYLYAPDYVDAVIWLSKNRVFFRGNLQIAKREIFVEYYDWVFYMLKKLGELYSNAISENERCFGYMVEDLMNIWYVKNAKRFRFALAPFQNLI